MDIDTLTYVIGYGFPILFVLCIIWEIVKRTDFVEDYLENNKRFIGWCRGPKMVRFAEWFAHWAEWLAHWADKTGEKWCGFYMGAAVSLVLIVVGMYWHGQFALIGGFVFVAALFSIPPPDCVRVWATVIVAGALCCSFEESRSLGHFVGLWVGYSILFMSQLIWIPIFSYICHKE